MPGHELEFLNSSPVELARIERKVDFFNHQLIKLFRVFGVDRCTCEDCAEYLSSVSPSEIGDIFYNGKSPDVLNESTENVLEDGLMDNGLSGLPSVPKFHRLNGNSTKSFISTHSHHNGAEASSTLGADNFSSVDRSNSRGLPGTGYYDMSSAEVGSFSLANHQVVKQTSTSDTDTGSPVSQSNYLTIIQSEPQAKKRRKAAVPMKVTSSHPATPKPEESNVIEASPNFVQSKNTCSPSSTELSVAENANQTPEVQDIKGFARLDDSSFLGMGMDVPASEMKPCPICRKMLHRGYLPNHIKAKHQNRQPASCNFCGKEFSFVSNLYRHLRKIHNATHLDNSAYSVATPPSCTTNATPAAASANGIKTNSLISTLTASQFQAHLSSLNPNIKLEMLVPGDAYDDITAHITNDAEEFSSSTNGSSKRGSPYSDNLVPSPLGLGGTGLNNHIKSLAKSINSQFSSIVMGNKRRLY